jgi:transposase
MHRIRSAQVKQRTAKVNRIRGLLAEHGKVDPIVQTKNTLI